MLTVPTATTIVNAIFDAVVIRITRFTNDTR